MNLLRYAKLSTAPHIDDWLARVGLQIGMNIESVAIDGECRHDTVGSETPTPRGLPSLTSSIARQRVDLLVASVEEIINDKLPRAHGISTCLSPPLLALGRLPQDLRARERLREFGVHATLAPAATLQGCSSLLHALAASRSWLSASLEQMPVVQLLQNLDTHRAIMVTVTCPHLSGLMAREANATGTTTPAAPCRGHGDEDCHGYFARLYIDSGKLLHAESNFQTGSEALAWAINLQHGQVHCSELFLRPNVTTLGASIQRCIMDAAVFWDESISTSRAPEPAQAIKPAAPQTKAPPRTQPMTDGSTHTQLTHFVHTTPELQGAAICDPQGWVDGVAGQMDAETVCAAVTMAVPALERAADLLGMGRPCRWTVGGTQATLYAGRGQRALVTAVGRNLANPDAVLRHILSPLGEGEPARATGS